MSTPNPTSKESESTNAANSIAASVAVAVLEALTAHQPTKDATP